MQYSIENFIKGIHSSTQNVKVKEEKNYLVFSRTYRNIENDETESLIFCKLTIAKLHEIEMELNNDYSFNELIMNNEKAIEVAIQQNDHFRPYYPITDRILFQVSEHNYDLEVSKMSQKYFFSLFCYLSEQNDTIIDFFSIYSRACVDDDAVPIDDKFFERIRILTVKINSLQEHPLLEYKHMLYSYLFNISYNSNISFSIADFERKNSFRRRSRRGGQLFPYKAYNQELTKYYYQAIATDIPFTQYLAFYHVAEFFFQTISEHDAFNEIESFITRPSFSPYKKEDIQLFYNKIKKKMRDQRDDGVWNEKVGLLLCLKKYVCDIESLKNSIISIDRTALDYYKNNVVDFADEGKIIDFDDITDNIFISIRDRVYAVRNSIVHSKEGDKLRYEPFKHDKQLAKEIPLIRSIAEEIIINSAKPLELNPSV